jgi:glycosyltransferase involved in cell wall biosynthesis
MPKVSVIVPNYNHAPFLQQRIDSILNQTFQDFELILLDDVSTDESLEVLNGYKTHDKVSHLIVNTKNSGSPFVQWRRGIEHSEGEYIWIAESDDFAALDFLEKSVAVLDENLVSTLVYSDSRIVDENGSELSFWGTSKNYHFNTKRWSQDYGSDGLDEILNYLLYRVTINNASAVLFRKKHLLDLDFDFLKKFKNAGDLFTYLSILLKGRINYIARPLNNYREHKLNITKTNKKNGVLYEERIRCYNYVLPSLCSGLNNKEQQKELQKAAKFILIKNSFKLIDFGYANELFKFIDQLSRYGILTKLDSKLLLFLFRVYQLNLYKLKGISRRIIKKRLN